MPCLRVLATVAVWAAYGLATGGPHAGEVEPVTPGRTEEIKAPDEVGLDSTRLDAFRKFVGGRGCVIRHG